MTKKDKILLSSKYFLNNNNLKLLNLIVIRVTSKHYINKINKDTLKVKKSLNKISNRLILQQIHSNFYNNRLVNKLFNPVMANRLKICLLLFNKMVNNLDHNINHQIILNKDANSNNNSLKLINLNNSIPLL